MPEDIQEIVASLPGLDDVNDLHKLIERRMARGDVMFVADLGAALVAAYGEADRPVWQFQSLFDSILRLLVKSPDREHLSHVLHLVGVTGSGEGRQARYMASLLASSKPAEDLAVVFAGGSQHKAAEELRACLIHELILRDQDVDEFPAIARWAASPHWAYHPLRWLPLSRSEIEEGHTLPNYSVRGSSYSLPFGPSRQDAPAATAVADVPAARETTTPEAAGEIATAVANWAEESNGRIEARSFSLSRPVGDIADLLPTLGLDCLASDRRQRRPGISVTAGGPSQVWRILFAAASSGGAYNSGRYGAYGRLEAWKSMAGLTGTPQTAPFTDVEQQVRDHRWFTFDAHTGWFDQVAWDIGIAALSLDRQRVTVLAATDTD